MRYQLNKYKEKFLLWFVWKLPRPIIYWSTIRAGANATTGDYSHQVVPDLKFMDALERWKRV